MLENILIRYFNLRSDWNNNYEKEKEYWYQSYEDLVSLIYDLAELGVINNADEIVDKLDKIDSED